MALEKLSNCLLRLEKDMISSLHIITDILRNETAKFKHNVAFVKRLKSQQIFIKDIKWLRQ
jgi:hypothetical protein